MGDLIARGMEENPPHQKPIVAEVQRDGTVIEYLTPMPALSRPGDGSEGA
jgi:hypothetical protein